MANATRKRTTAAAPLHGRHGGLAKAPLANLLTCRSSRGSAGGVDAFEPTPTALDG